MVNDNPNPGDENWPTQPFPVKPPPLARMTFQLDDVAKVTPEHEAYCKGLLALEGGAIGGGPYAQYGPKLRVIFPGWVGGGNWSTPAFNPDLGYIYVTSQDLGNLNKMVPSADGSTYKSGRRRRGSSEFRRTLLGRRQEMAVPETAMGRD